LRAALHNPKVRNHFDRDDSPEDREECYRPPTCGAIVTNDYTFIETSFFGEEGLNPGGNTIPMLCYLIIRLPTKTDCNFSLRCKKNSPSKIGL